MKISIIIASYNYAQYIEEAIDSVINQSYQDWEMIIVDDGSSDNSVEIIKTYCEKDNRIKFLQHEDGQNKGLKETILLALKHSSGEWIAFLESDDYFLPDYLVKKAEIVEKYSDVKLIFNKVKFLDENNGQNKKQKRRFEKKQKKLSSINFPRNMFYDFYINNMILTFSCVMVESSTLKAMNFDTPTDFFLDWWLWIHLAYKNDFYYIDEELTSWRLHDFSYIKIEQKPIFQPLQVRAYKDVYNKNDKSLKLLCFILFSNIKLFFIKSLRFFTKNIL